MQSSNTYESHEGRGYLPFEYLLDFIHFLKSNRHVIEVITYGQLDWGDDFNPDTMYKAERSRWRSWLSADPGRQRKIYVLLQFDVDAEPEQTMAIIRHMKPRGVAGNVMIFNRRVNRQKLREKGEIELTDYPIDDALLSDAASQGFVIGYHCNAVERAQYDLSEAVRCFRSDVAELRARFPGLVHFSPHGGVPSKEGINNNDIPVGEELQRELGVRWVHNKRAPSFDGGYSDGGFANPNKDPDRLDLRAAVLSWRPGKRYRVLIHPQYYIDAASPDAVKPPNVMGRDWYEQVWDSYAAKPHTVRWYNKFLHHLETRRPGPIWGLLRFNRRREGFEVIGSGLAKLRGRLARYVPSRPAVAALATVPVAPLPAASPPVFVRGMSRSGGTLVVTLLDAHPDIAMSYELYPDLLRGRARSDAPVVSAEFESEVDAHDPLDLRELLSLVESNPKNALRVLAEHGLSDARVFLARAGRSGVEIPELCAILQEHLAAGQDVRTVEGRLRLIERVALEKMQREKKRRWGAKCSSQFESYLSVWPDARFINIIRDGRDVLASQQNTGNFTNTAAEVGRAWAETHLKFRQLVEHPHVNALEIIYEELASDPESVARKICDFLGVSYASEMLQFHDSDLSIFKSPRGHLSINRISQPIDASKIGRWRQDLSAADIEEFWAAAGDAMETFGYKRE